MARVEPGHEQMTEEEEKIRIAEEERRREEREREDAAARMAAREALSKPRAGIKPEKAEVQVTGGSKAIAPDEFPDKDSHLEITLRGWVKQDKDVTVKQGESATRIAVVVTDEILSMRLVDPPQLSLEDDREPGEQEGGAA